MTIAKPDDMAAPLKSMILRAAFLFVRENSGLAIGKDKRSAHAKTAPGHAGF